MRIAVIGCGSIGRRHLQNLRSLGEHDLIVFDPAIEQTRQFAETIDARVAQSLDDVFARPVDLALICTPPHEHVTAGCRAITAGAHLFVEKPIGTSLDGVDVLLAQAAGKGLDVCVGYNLRFHAGLRRMKDLIDANAVGRVLMLRAEVGQYLPDWRPNQDYRHGYIARPETGGGIIFDASHEIDYVRWLGGEIMRVYCAAGHLSSLELETEDSAAMVLRMKSGMLAEVHLDCVQRGYARTCKVIGEEGTLIWDFKEGVRLLRAGQDSWECMAIRPDTNEMYLEQTRHLLRCVRGEAAPAVDGATGRRVLAIALAARRSAELGCEIDVS